MRHLPVILWLFGVMACAGAPPKKAWVDPNAQTFRTALQLMCEVDQRAGLAGIIDPVELTRQREDWLIEHIENPDGIYLLTMWRMQGPAEQAATLLERTRTEGLATCPLASTLQAEARDTPP